MLIDHTGHIFFPDMMILRIIGRLSLPLFAYCIAQGYQSTGNLKKYILRLLLFAVIAQIPYSYFNQTRLNILFCFVLALLILKLKEQHGSWIYLFLLPLSFLHLEYGVYSIALVIAFYKMQEDRKKGTILLILSTITYSIIYLQYLQVLSIITLILIPSLEKIRFKLNKYVFYWIYPVQWMALVSIKLLM